MIIQVLVAFLATVSFAALFNVPSKQYIYCGITGAIGWFFYLLLHNYNGSVVVASFVATAVLTAVSRLFAVHRKTPITIFLIAGIFPLVPGAGIYYTAYYLITNDNMMALNKGLETAKIAVAIALGIVCVFSLPYGFFKGIGRKQ